MSILILGTIPAAPSTATFSGSRLMYVGTNDNIAVDPITGSNADGRQVFELLVQALPSDVTLDSATWEGHDLSVDPASGATVLPHTFDGSTGLVLRVPDHQVAWGVANTLAVGVTRSGVDPGPLSFRVDEFFLGGISGGTLDIATWGKGDRGQLFDGTTADNGEPTVNRTQVASVAGGAGEPTWTALAGGGTEGPGVYGVGDNAAGQLSQGSADVIAHATAVLLLRNSRWAGHEAFTYPLHFDQLAFGFDHAVGIDDHRRVWAWGRNDRGQLGDGTTTDRAFPVPVTWEGGTPSMVRHFVALQMLPGDGFTVFVTHPATDGGTLWTTGTVPGVGTSTRAVQLSADQGWTLPLSARCSAPRHCVALRTDPMSFVGTYWAFGSNECGQCLTGAASAAIGLTSVMPQVPSAGVTNGLPALGPDGTAWIVEDQNVATPDRFQLWAVGRPHPLGDGAGLVAGADFTATPTRIPFPDLEVNPDDPTQWDTMRDVWHGRGHRLVARQRPWGLTPTDPDEIAATDPADMATTWWSQGWDDHGQRGLGDVGGGYDSAFELLGGTPDLGAFAVTGAVGWDSNWARLLPVERGAPWAQWCG